MVKLTQSWSWHSVTQSIDFPAGVDVDMTPEQEAAAIAAGVLEKESDNGDEGAAKAGAKGRARSAQA